MITSIRNEGHWPPILAWLDALAGGELTIPFGMHPPVTRNPETGALRVYGSNGLVSLAKIGEYVLWDAEGGFRVATEVPT